MNVDKKEFELLKKNILNISLRILEKCEPEKIKTFKNSLELTRNPDIAKSALKGIQIKKPYKEWREIFIDVVDVDLQICRVENSLILLNSAPPRDFPLGDWVEYHYCAWPVLTQGLLYRVEKLVKDVVRDILKPANHKELELAILKPIEKSGNQLSKVRDPIAHTRGAIDAIREDSLVELIIATGGYHTKEMFIPMADNKLRWFEMLDSISEQIISEVMNVCENLNKNVKWKID